VSYSNERKEHVLRQLLPPHSQSVPVLSKETGIPLGTLYCWRQQARASGIVVVSVDKKSSWSSQAKFGVVLESAALSEVELAEYCRCKGVFVEQIQEWRKACEQANASQPALSREEREQMKVAQKRIKELERERRRDKAALAEAAALLVLSKKVEAMWRGSEDA
jgi:transposase-like protein